MNKRGFMPGLFALVLILTSPGALQQNAEQLYQSGLYQEDVAGDLSKAIAIYQDILKRFPGNREVAAKAQLHLGFCYEKSGLKQAQEAFQKVVENYPEQSEAVKAAQAKLALFLKAQTPAAKDDKEFQLRQVWAGRDAELTGSPSADGRFLSTTDWKTGDVAIRDLTTGEMRRVTKTADVMQSNIFALNAIYSPDNQWIAYAWYDPKKFQGFDLWLTGADGTGAHLLYHDETASVFPDAWTPDGKNIIATVSASKEKVKQIVLVSAANGSARLLKSSIPDRFSTKISVSPDGRSLVYDMPQADGKRDIFLFSLPDGPETRLVEHPADDGVPIWQPDGEKVLFMSDRTGSPALWAQKVAYGKAVALPELVKQDIGGSFIPMGFTRNGALYYGIATDISDVYVATIDLKAGRVLEPPAPISQQMVGTRYLASWSPDGKYLAYLRMRTPGTPGHTIIIRNFDGGEERSLHVDASTIRRLAWFADGTAVIFPGLDRDRRPGVFQLDLKSGAVTTLVHAEPNVVIPQAGVTRDGKSLVYLAMNIVSGSQPIVVRDLQTGQEKVITKPSPTPTGMALSPDGQQVAVTTADEASGRHTVIVVPVAGGAAREIYGVDKPRAIVRLPSWTPDGRQILCAITLQDKREYFLLPADGGEPQKLASPMNGITDFSFHPDGQRLAFSAGRSQSEVWVMENFLPPLKVAK
ncbi:MAG: tetratricopeptide repeat protein [Candidatus Aminicenantes bacterium]|nr:tetratricopeptide repeat protein [Candidatus Aminicenantes bacterium]